MQVKICGLTDPLSVKAAIAGGARYVGFVFFKRSPRNISVNKARELALMTPPGVCKVALVVDADDDQLDDITQRVPLDMLQLHGTETPARVAEIRERYGLPVMKAIGISGAEDLSGIDAYAPVVDQLLIDAKPPKGSDIPGGNGLSFDWNLLKGRRWAVPWMLAGGLSAENVVDATVLAGATQVDVSSAVERERGVKDPALISAFLAAANA